MLRSIGSIGGTKRGERRRFPRQGMESGVGEFDKWKFGLQGNGFGFGFGWKRNGWNQSVGESWGCHWVWSVKWKTTPQLGIEAWARSYRKFMQLQVNVKSKAKEGDRNNEVEVKKAAKCKFERNATFWVSVRAEPPKLLLFVQARFTVGLLDHKKYNTHWVSGIANTPSKIAAATPWITWFFCFVLS